MAALQPSVTPALVTVLPPGRSDLARGPPAKTRSEAAWEPRWMEKWPVRGHPNCPLNSAGDEQPHQVGALALHAGAGGGAGLEQGTNFVHRGHGSLSSEALSLTSTGDSDLGGSGRMHRPVVPRPRGVWTCVEGSGHTQKQAWWCSHRLSMCPLQGTQQLLRARLGGHATSEGPESNRHRERGPHCHELQRDSF